MNAHGKVTLVGAGPGDPELLTLKAVRAIEAATVLLVDDLVSDAVVALARPGVRLPLRDDPRRRGVRRADHPRG